MSAITTVQTCSGHTDIKGKTGHPCYPLDKSISVDSAISVPSTYPLDSDQSGGS